MVMMTFSTTNYLQNKLMSNKNNCTNLLLKIKSCIHVTFFRRLTYSLSGCVGRCCLIGCLIGVGCLAVCFVVKAAFVFVLMRTEPELFRFVGLKFIFHC